jgi:YVTN family beta-propeller protein
VIDTTTNTVTATVDAGSLPIGVAVTPDGKYVYVANSLGAGPEPFPNNNVSVIDTATNRLVATVGVGQFPVAVGIIPDVPFLAFGANLVIAFGGVPNQIPLRCKPASS